MKGPSKGVCQNPQCKREFTLNVPWQKYCCDRCRFEAWVLRKVQVTVSWKAGDLELKQIKGRKNERKP